mgnify:CR=1 FL=1
MFLSNYDNMKSDKQLAEYIFDIFRAAHCKAGHIVMMRTFENKLRNALNPKEQEIIFDVANRLIDNGYIEYEDGSRGLKCLRLTKKGFDYIYDDNIPLEGFEAIVPMVPAAAMDVNSIVNTNTSAYNQKVHNQTIVMKSKPIYKIFVSSTFKDLIEERIKVMTTIVNCGHLPIGMEQFPAAPIEAWEYIKLLIDNADYYLLLLAGKYGTVHPKTGKSYTQMEYEYAKEKGVPVIFLTYKDVNKLPFGQCESDPAIRQKLEEFRKDASINLRQTWESIDELAYKVKDSIDKTIEMFPRTGWVRADSIVKEKKEKLDIDLSEVFEFYKDDNPFVKEQSGPASITLKDFIIGAGSALKDYCQVTNIRDALINIANISYNDLDKILERLLFLKVIERGEVNNEYDGCYKVWSFTEKGLKLYLDLKFKQVNIKKIT